MLWNVTRDTYPERFAGALLQVEIITMALMPNISTGGMPFVGPAYETAKEDIRQLFPQLNVTQTFIKSGPAIKTCVDFEEVTDDVLSKYYYESRKDKANDTVTVFIFTGCTEAEKVAQFAAGLDKLMVTSVKAGVRFPNATLWPTWITTTTNAEDAFASTVDKVITLYQWRNFVLLCDLNSNVFFITFFNMLKTYLLKPGENRQMYTTVINSALPIDYTVIVNNIAAVARVTFYFGNSKALHEILITAAQYNMTSPEYVYLAFVPDQRPTYFGPFTWHGDRNANDTAEQDAIAQKAYRSLFMINGDSQQGRLAKYDQELIRMWKKQSKEVFNYTYGHNEAITQHPFSTYSAMLAMSEVVEELRQKGRWDILQSGQRIVKQMKNRTYTLRSGIIRINEFGERIPTMIMTQSDVVTREVRTVVIDDEKGFRLNENVTWNGPWPVPNVPRCGFRGDAPACQQRDLGQMNVIYGVCSAGFLAIIITAGFFARRFFLMQWAGMERFLLLPEHMSFPVNPDRLRLSMAMIYRRTSSMETFYTNHMKMNIY